MNADILEVYWRSLVLFAGDWGGRILAAAIVAVVAYLIARTARWALAAAVDRLPLTRSLETASAEGAAAGATVGQRLGEAAFWLVILFALPQALHALRLDAIVAPLDATIAKLFAFLPNMIGAALIFAIGMLAANVARKATLATLTAAGAEKWSARIGLSGGAGLVGAAGHAVYALVVIPVSIAALEALKVEAISAPAIDILRAVLDAIPRLFGAAILLGLTVAVGRFTAGLVEDLLPKLGFDGLVSRLGVAAGPAGAPPSRMAATGLMIAITIFGAIEALRLLNFVTAAAILTAVLELGGRVVFGAAIILAGALIARSLGDIVARTAGESGGLAAMLTRAATLALSIAMGLRFMGLAPEIVTLAFGLTLGSIAVAAALAFGLGGRSGAARVVDDWIERLPAPDEKARAAE